MTFKNCWMQRLTWLYNTKWCVRQILTHEKKKRRSPEEQHLWVTAVRIKNGECRLDCLVHPPSSDASGEWYSLGLEEHPAGRKSKMTLCTRRLSKKILVAYTKCLPLREPNEQRPESRRIALFRKLLNTSATKNPKSSKLIEKTRRETRIPNPQRIKPNSKHFYGFVAYTGLLSRSLREWPRFLSK